MAGQRQPIELVIARGKKNLTKAEIAERRASEVQPNPDGISAPAILTAKQKAHFEKLAGQLQRIRIMGESDCETLARYVVAQENYERAVKDLRAAQRIKPKITLETMVEYSMWLDGVERIDKRLDRYFKLAQTTAAALGMTISSRCKLQVPVKEEEEKKNKFELLGKAADAK